MSVHASPVASSDAVVRLLEAATEAFAARGFHATTTRDIASRAGLSPAGVYVHFSSKEALLYQLSLAGHEAALRLLQEAADGASSPAEALSAMVGGFTTWHAAHSRVARIVQYEFEHLTPEHREEIRALRKQVDRVVRRVIQRGADLGDFEVSDVRTTTLALLSLAVDVARWFPSERHQTPEEIGDSYSALALRLVHAR